MIEYVCGFLISEEFDSILMVKKLKPDWQAGLWNGVGGKVEEGETAREAMKREFKEETGLDNDNWRVIGTITDFYSEWKVHFYTQPIRYPPNKNNFGDWVNDSGEQLAYLSYQDLLDGAYRGQTILNLNWIIPFIHYDKTSTFEIVEVQVV